MPNNIQTENGLDQIDLHILGELQAEGRITNAELAARVGIAPSTSLARVRALVDQGVITGFAAGVNSAALGYSLEVLISVSVRAGARQKISELAASLREAPGVKQLFFLGGVEDFIVHLVAKDSDHVRDFVVTHLSEHPAVSSTRTSIVFSHDQNPVSPPLR